MKMKKLLSILLVISMIATMLVGCGKSEKVTTDNTSTKASSDAESTAASEPAKIVVALMCFAPMDSSKTDAVEKYVNDITQKKINVTVDLKWFDAATYGTQVPMMLQANDQIDLVNFNPVPATSFSSFMAQNQLMDISSYIEKDGADIKKTLGDTLAATTTSKGIFGVGNYGPLSGSETILMRKDILDQLGLTEKAKNMKTWSDYEEILKQVVDKTELAGVINGDAEGTVLSPMPYVNGGENFSDAAAVDTLGDNFNQVYVDESTGKVVSNYSTEAFYNTAKRAKKWYDEGLIYKDAATAKDYADTLIKNGVGFSRVGDTEAGAEESSTAATGFEMIGVKIAQKNVTTGTMRKFGFAVPVTSKQPEAAVKFLNLLYADQDLANTITWGVKGTDWVDNGNGEATYPDGVTAQTVNYHTADFLYGNRLFSTPWEGSKQFREEMVEENKTAPVSKYMGFSIDTSNVTDIVTACANVINQYKPGLMAGSVNDVDKTYKEFNDKLKAAGMDKLIAEYQKQLDAWVATQK